MGAGDHGRAKKIPIGDSKTGTWGNGKINIIKKTMVRNRAS
jgi:hypothetical protein